MKLEVTFTPADFAALQKRDLSKTVCVVFDVLRATSSMLEALSKGAAAIIPVSEIAEAVALKRERPEVLLAGERDGVRIRAAQSGGVDFDFGNSPRDFVAEKVRGHTIVWTTTNGTRALQACARARTVLIGSISNLVQLAAWIKRNKPTHLVLVCAGTYEEAAYEDTLAAGALANAVWSLYEKGHIADSAQMAARIHDAAQNDFMTAMQFSRNAQRLLSNPELRDDVRLCLQGPALPLLAELRNGQIQKLVS